MKKNIKLLPLIPQINYELNIDKRMIVNNELLNNVEYITYIEIILDNIIKNICNKNIDIDDIYNQNYQYIRKLCYSNRVITDNLEYCDKEENQFYNKETIRDIYDTLYNYDYKYLCKGINTIRQYNITINKKNDKINLINILNNNNNNNNNKLKYCNCNACEQYDYMNKKLRQYILMNNLDGVIDNMIPSFVDKDEYHILYKITDDYRKNKKLNFFY